MIQKNLYKFFNLLAEKIHMELGNANSRRILRMILTYVENDEIIIKNMTARYQNSLKRIIREERKKIDISKEKHLDKLIDDCIKNSNAGLDN